MENFPEFVINNWLLFLALAVIIFLLAKDIFSESLSGIRNVAPVLATQMINHENAIILDVREENEFKEGHILNSIHIPLKNVEKKLKELEKYKSQPVIVNCRSGHRSMTACKLLSKNGFEKVFNMGGGMLAWKTAKLPVSKA
ncbi:MAG: rhodanese-like domain-containing protein [Gammaproteobacteria bacterium]|nr:rhodanese-like domain-containing protein [Gammaproteobacteria bacterium]